MLRTLRKTLRPSDNYSLAKAFSRLGWIGFWIQVVIGSIPVFLVYALILGVAVARARVGDFWDE